MNKANSGLYSYSVPESPSWEDSIIKAPAGQNNIASYKKLYSYESKKSKTAKGYSKLVSSNINTWPLVQFFKNQEINKIKNNINNNSVYSHIDDEMTDEMFESLINDDNFEEKIKSNALSDHYEELDYAKSKSKEYQRKWAKLKNSKTVSGCFSNNWLSKQTGSSNYITTVRAAYSRCASNTGDLTPKYVSNNKCGYANKSGFFIKPAIYTECEKFKNGVAIVKYKGKFGMISKNKGWVIKNRYNELYEHNKINYRGVENLSTSYDSCRKDKIKKRYTVFNRYGKKISSEIYNQLVPSNRSCSTIKLHRS